jgi:hypothetical protein
VRIRCRNPNRVTKLLQSKICLRQPSNSPSHLPPLLWQFTYFSCAKHTSKRRNISQNYSSPPSPRSFALQPPALPPSPSHLAMTQTLPLPEPNLGPISPLMHPIILIQTPTVPWHARGLRFSDTRPDPFASHLSWDWNVGEPQTRMEVSVGNDADGNGASLSSSR